PALRGGHGAGDAAGRLGPAGPVAAARRDRDGPAVGGLVRRGRLGERVPRPGRLAARRSGTVPGSPARGQVRGPGGLSQPGLSQPGLSQPGLSRGQSAAAGTGGPTCQPSASTSTGTRAVPSGTAPSSTGQSSPATTTRVS